VTAGSDAEDPAGLSGARRLSGSAGARPGYVGTGDSSDASAEPAIRFASHVRQRHVLADDAERGKRGHRGDDDR
jgi:hypothetical protein